jgi:peptidyl-tRNA hydrolase
MPTKNVPVPGMVCLSIPLVTVATSDLTARFCRPGGIGCRTHTAWWKVVFARTGSSVLYGLWFLRAMEIWAMQLVVRAEKADPPTHRAACAAAAMAVVHLLTDPRAVEVEGEWHERVRTWEDVQIRKVARRARGVRWEAVQELPGVLVDHEGAQARAFVPGPVAEIPPELARLQVAGLDLPDEEGPKPPDGPYAAIALNPSVTMTTGKAAAQCGHAAQLLLRQGDPREVLAWIAAGLPVHVVGDVPWNECVGRATTVVRDAGYTEVPPGTMTAISWLQGLPPGR